MSNRGVWVAALCLGVILSGCGVSTAPKTVATYDPEGRARVQNARYSGQYELFAVAKAQAAAKPQAGSEPLLSVHLTKGQRFGFEKTEAGVSAVAGDRSVAIESRPHLWQIRADAGQRDWMTPAGGGAAIAIISIMVGVGVTAALLL